MEYDQTDSAVANESISSQSARRPTASRMYAGKEWDPVVYSAIGVTIFLVFLADLYTPLGVAVWIFYLIPVLLTLFIWQPWTPPAVSLLVTIMMFIGFAVSSAGMNPEIARLNRGFGIGVVWIMAIVGFLFIRNKITVRQQNWLQSAQTELSRILSGEQTLSQLGDNVLRYLAEYVEAHVATIFASVGSGFARVGTYGLSADAGMPDKFQPGEGLLGQAAKDRRIIQVNDVPEGHLTVASSLRRGKPRYLVIAPFLVDGVANSVIELGFIHRYDEAVIELLERLSDSIGVAIRSANYRTHLQELLEETQRQGEELQAQAEELRVSNEELDEQSRALKEAHVQLENEQSELEQTNVQLEEQTHRLEGQKQELTKSAALLEAQASELEQASQYKSDFLANMSHELRTPLNSSLILAKLLADNPNGNLTEEQVQFAGTIRSAGNDLLILINDILDLSKIEAGRMDVRPEPVRIKQLIDDLARMFEPVAGEKKLNFSVQVLPGCPEVIETDRQRLEQVLKNLLSNAFKFTEKGGVILRFSRSGDERVEFAVEDTGIGIPKNQQEMVFEAFRQADGTTNRKYGGTGLGLSISRELSRLLGGELHLESEPGRGSTFSVKLPNIYDQSRVRPRKNAAIAQPSAKPAILPDSSKKQAVAAQPDRTNSAPISSRWVEDDRERLTGNNRLLLVVEDDAAFGRILANLAHELNFQCLIATSAEEGLVLAMQYLPSAVLLDIGLPDHSGLTVLDRLKHDVRTRHIPVHVVSADDNTETAFALGAVGYLIKPVEREKLVEALKRIEMRLSERVRRVLIVEDDAVQLDAIRRLLGTQEVETVGVGTAADCLEQLKGSTFDCMVLDLSLPDATGYSLLETLSQEDAYSFPPVIIYTGRELTADNELMLSRYSKSIIIKGAKSPERLLDEVSLFLHQVVAKLPPEHQRMLAKARSRDAALEGRRILVVEDDVRNVFAVTSVLEPQGVKVQIARNGREGIKALENSLSNPALRIDLVLMDVMMPEMDGITATCEIRKRPEWKKLPIIMLTAKAMRDDQESCLAAGANDYLAKPLDVEKLLSLIRVWMPR